MSPHLAQVRALVGAQLKLDLRHPKTGKTQTSRAALTVGSYAFSALVLAFSLVERGVLLQEFLFAGLSFTAVLAAFGVAGSYDDLMGRPRDYARMLTYPVPERVLYVARLVNVGIFAMLMSLSAAAPLAGFAAWQYGAGTGLAVGGALVVMMLGVTFAILGAVWALTLVAPIRLQRAALATLRALLIGALVLGYQWVATQDTLHAEAPWWPAQWVIAAGWGGAPWAWGALAAAAALLAVSFGRLFPYHYVGILQRTAESENKSRAQGKTTAAPRSWERWTVTGPEARAAYGFAAAALKGDRLVRGRVWPAAMLAFVFAGFAWWTGGLGDLFVHGAENVLMDPAIQMHLSVMTVLLFVAQTCVQAVQISDHPEAAWSFDVLPVQSARTLQVGAQQALFLRVLLPLHAALAVLLAFSMPVLHAALHAGFWLAGCAILTRIMALARNYAPFTRRSDKFSAGERIVPLLLAIPMALVLLLVQTLTFTRPLSAVLVVFGLLLLHAALGRLALTSVRVPTPYQPLPSLEKAAS